MKFFILLFFITLLAGCSRSSTESANMAPSLPTISGTESKETNSVVSPPGVIAQNLDTPWAIAFLPDGDLLVTERKGTVLLVDTEAKVAPKTVATLSSVREISEGGLLGIAVHPDFATNNSVYLYYTYKNSGDDTFNRVVKMTYANETLSDEQIVIDTIPGAGNHNGGRIAFGTDKLLYIGTGDAGEPSQAQDTNSLAGKILRVTDEGKAAPGNPFSNEVFSYGHRNVQGLAWDSNGKLWATEHGRSGVTSGFDELNLIQSGKNYGWPEIQGDETRNGMETPNRHSGSSSTWAPSGMGFLNGSMYFSGLRGAALYKATLTGETVSDFSELFKGEYGRLREVITGPDGMLYITTSNKDGRGTPKTGDDKIIRLDPAKL